MIGSLLNWSEYLTDPNAEIPGCKSASPISLPQWTFVELMNACLEVQVMEEPCMSQQGDRGKRSQKQNSGMEAL